MLAINSMQMSKTCKEVFYKSFELFSTDTFNKMLYISARIKIILDLNIKNGFEMYIEITTFQDSNSILNKTDLVQKQVMLSEFLSFY